MARRNTARAFSRAAVDHERRADVMALRISGLSMGAIASKLKMSKSTVKAHVDKALQAMAQDDADSAARYRALASMRLDRLLVAVWDRAIHGSTEHLREARLIIESHARLMGLNMPMKVAATDPEGKPMAMQFWVPVAADMSIEEWLARHTEHVEPPVTEDDQ